MKEAPETVPNWNGSRYSAVNKLKARSRRRHGVFRANNGGQLFLFQHESASSCI